MIKQMTVHELATLLKNNKDAIKLIDVREPHEREISSIGGELIPLGTIADVLPNIAKDKPIVVYCRSGGRSQHAAEILVDNGFTDVANLSGGILAWIRDIDNTLTPY